MHDAIWRNPAMVGLAQIRHRMRPTSPTFSADVHEERAIETIAARMDSLPATRLHFVVTALCALGFAFDLAEMALGNILSAVFSLPPYRASPRELGWLLASVYVGAIFGAPLLGHWADRHGRRKLLIGALGWLGVTSLLAAWSPTTDWLLVARALAGLALGAYPPLMFAYLTDILPPAQRGRLTFITVALGALGPPLAIFGVRAFGVEGWRGIEAWRWAFIAGAIGAILVAWLFRRLPESPRWLAVQGRHEEAEAACAAFERSASLGSARSRVSRPLSEKSGVSALDQPGRREAQRVRLPAVGLLYFLSPWSTVAFPLLIGAVLVNKGFRLADTLLFVGVSTFGLVVGSGLSSTFIDRLQRRTALAGCAAAMAASGVLFALSSSPFWLMATSTLFTFFAALYTPTLSMYGAEVFPTARRARYSSLAWACNRVGAALAPLVLLPMLHAAGALAMSLTIAAVLICSLAVLCACPAGYAGRPVQ